MDPKESVNTHINRLMCLTRGTEFYNKVEWREHCLIVDSYVDHMKANMEIYEPAVEEMLWHWRGKTTKYFYSDEHYKYEHAAAQQQALDYVTQMITQ